MFFAPQYSGYDYAIHIVVLALFCVGVSTGFLYCFPQVLQKRFVTPKAVKKSAAKAAEEAREKPDMAKVSRQLEALNSSILRDEATRNASESGGRR